MGLDGSILTITKHSISCPVNISFIFMTGMFELAREIRQSFKVIQQTATGLFSALHNIKSKEFQYVKITKLLG